MRRIHRMLAGGLCAGAALLSGAAAVAQQPVMPVGYHAAVRGHSGHGQYCAPPCHAYPHSYSPHYYAPCLPDGTQAPTEAPRDEQSRDDAQQPTPDQTPDTTPDATPSPSFSSASAATGTPSAPASASPNMIGDFFGTGKAGTLRVIGDPFLDPGGGGSGVAISDPNESTVGRIKQAENFSPIPRDRLFLDYTTYSNVPIGPNTGGAPPSINVQRFTPGFERTFLDGLIAVDLRMPFASTLDSSVSYGFGSNDASNFEPGNLTVSAKVLLLESQYLAVGAGLGVRTPTADDLAFSSPTAVVEIQNEAVHLLPYVGAIITPNSTFFGQAMLQVDTPVSGNDVYLTQGGVRTFQGDIEDQTFLFTSFALGAWLWDDPYADTLTSVATTLELHHSSSVSDADALTTGQMSIADNSNNFDSFTGMIGLHLFYGGGAQVTFAYGVPLADDQFADGEFRMMLNLGEPFGLLPNLATR